MFSLGLVIFLATYLNAQADKKKEASPRAEPVAQAAPPRPAPQVAPTTLPPPPPGPTILFQDLEEAKREAERWNRDVAVLFLGSDWDDPSRELVRAVEGPLFKERIRNHFVLALLELPQEGAGAHEAVRSAYGIEFVPTLVLLDARGQPYAYEPRLRRKGDFSGQFEALQKKHDERDRLLEAVAEAKGPTKLAAARPALDFLQKNRLLWKNGPYEGAVREWVKLAEAQDPKNAKGDYEHFFVADWSGRLRRTGPEDKPEMGRLLRDLDGWKKTRSFRDRERAARLHFEAGALLRAAGMNDAALKYFQAAKDYQPQNRPLRGALADPDLLAGYGVGTGFAVSADGLLLTNAHVVAGPGRVSVRLPQRDDRLPAEVVARDPGCDLALLRVKPAGVTLTPLPLGTHRAVQRAEELAAWGFPHGDVLGSGVKYLQGRVSGLPGENADNWILANLAVTTATAAARSATTAATSPAWSRSRPAAW